MSVLQTAVFVSRHPVLSLLSADDQDRLVLGSTSVGYVRGDPVWHPGRPADEFVIVQEGTVARFLGGHADRPLLAALDGPEDFADLSASIGAAPRTRLAISHTNNTTLLKAPRSLLIEMLHRRPEALLALQACLARECDALLQRLALASAPAASRLAHLLLQLADRGDHDREVTDWITREHMAQYIGTTSETVTRTLGSWARAGIIEKRSRGLKLCQPAALARMVGPSR